MKTQRIKTLDVEDHSMCEIDFSENTGAKDILNI